MNLSDLWGRLSGRPAAQEDIEIAAMPDDLAELAGILPRLTKEMLEKLEWSREDAQGIAQFLLGGDGASIPQDRPMAVRLPEQQWKRIYRVVALLRQQGMQGWTTRLMARISAASIKAHRWP